jgi:hypothetical protein
MLTTPSVVKCVLGLRDVVACFDELFFHPSHVGGDIMSIVYAVAEKGADLIREDAGRA